MTEQAKEIAYGRARSFIDEKKEKSFVEAKKILEEMLDYKDAKKYYDLCIIEIDRLSKEREEAKTGLYAKALEMMVKPTTTKIDVAIKYFIELDDYLDSKEKVEECRKIRHNISVKDKKGLQRLRAAGLFCCGIGLVAVVFVVCAMIWESC